jgi:hypothetical protein
MRESHAQEVIVVTIFPSASPGWTGMQGSHAQEVIVVTFFPSASRGRAGMQGAHAQATRRWNGWNWLAFIRV